MVKCDTTTCQGAMGWRYTWPGRNEMRVCIRCATRAVSVAEAMGFDLQIQPCPVVLCEAHHVAHAEAMGVLHTTDTPEALREAATKLRALDREIMQCEACKR